VGPTDCNANEKIWNNNNLTNEQIKEETKRDTERERLAAREKEKSRSERRAALCLL
jgi:hypothetical protein